MNQAAPNKTAMSQAIDIAINLLIVFLILGLCLQILSPFLPVVVWGAVVAIAIYPAFLKLKALLGGRSKLSITVFVLVSFCIVIIPLWSFGGSIIETALDLRKDLEAGSVVVPPPSESVREWPVIGEKVHGIWSEASTSISGFLEEHADQVRNIGMVAVSKAANVGKETLAFLISIGIAAAFLAGANGASREVRRFFLRLSPRQGEELMAMSIATVRSVAVGVLGVAIIQAVLAGIGLAVVGVPAAGVWALLVLIVAVAQLPPILILGPIAIYVFSVESTTVAVLFLIWSILVSFSDAALKPMLLGRGLDTPMLVVLLGAIGGMLASGIIGLFVGAVVLSVGYKLFMAWLEAGEEPAVSSEAT
jgi:predicted PurR-regulated permease PerM